MRQVKIALLVFFAVAFGVIAFGPLSNLWSDYRDSPISTYLLAGLPPLVLAVSSLVGAILVLRRQYSLAGPPTSRWSKCCFAREARRAQRRRSCDRGQGVDVARRQVSRTRSPGKPAAIRRSAMNLEAEVAAETPHGPQRAVEPPDHAGEPTPVRLGG